MRIKLSEEVFSLVKGLSRTEKAYLKKRGFGKTDSKLSIGFDIINGFDAFDDNAISQKLKAQKVDPKEFYKRLLPVILKSLGQYHSGSSPEIELNEIIIASRLLINRKQKTLALREIERGIDIARTSEHYPSLVELNRLKQVALRISHTPTSEEDTDQYYDSLEAVENLERGIHLDYLYRRVSALSQVGIVSKAAREELLNEILNHPAVAKPEKETYGAYVQRIRIQTACYYFSGQWEKAIDHGHRLLDGMPHFEEGSDHDIRSRLVMLMDLANLYQLTYDCTGYSKVIEQMQIGAEFSSAFFDLAASKLEMGLSISEQFHKLWSGQITESIRVGEELLENTSPQLLVPVIKKRIMAAIALAYFLQQNYSKAIQYINTEFPFSESESVNDRIRWLELLCWFHSDDQALFESKWLSWSRQLKKADSGYEWEDLVMKAMKQSFGKSKSEISSLMNELNQKLTPVDQELRTALVGSFDFLLWSESLAIGKPMVLLLKERYLHS